MIAERCACGAAKLGGNVIVRTWGKAHAADRCYGRGWEVRRPPDVGALPAATTAAGFADTRAATAEANARGEGFKADASKADWFLFPFDGARLVLEVLEIGARKYAPGNWRKVPDGAARYRRAFMRHAVAMVEGEELDPETGKSHLAHAACCALFVLALEAPGKVNGKGEG